MPIPFQVDEEMFARRSLPPDGIYQVAAYEEVQDTAPDGTVREFVQLTVVDPNTADSQDVRYSVRKTANGLLAPSCKAGQLQRALAELDSTIADWSDVVGKTFRFEARTTTLRDGRSFTTFLPVELVASAPAANGLSEDAKERLRQYLTVPKTNSQVLDFFVNNLRITDPAVINAITGGTLAAIVPEVEKTAAGQYVWKRGA